MGSDFDPERASLGELRAAYDRLLGEVETLREALGLSRNHIPLQTVFGLTRAQAIILLQLADGKPHTHTALMLGYSAANPSPPGTEVVKQLMVRIRRAVEPFGVIIETTWGSGFCIVAGRDVIGRVLAGEAVVPAVVPDRAAGKRGPGAGKKEWRLAVIETLRAMTDATGTAIFTGRMLRERVGLTLSVGDTLRRLQKDGMIRVNRCPSLHARHARTGVWSVTVVVDAKPEKAAA